MKTLKEVFGTEKPIIGMLHLAGFGAHEKLEIAKKEIESLYRSGVTAVLAENYFGRSRDVENVLAYLQKTYPHKIYGVNILGDPEQLVHADGAIVGSYFKEQGLTEYPVDETRVRKLMAAAVSGIR